MTLDEAQAGDWSRLNSPAASHNKYSFLRRLPARKSGISDRQGDGSEQSTKAIEELSQAQPGHDGHGHGRRTLTHSGCSSGETFSDAKVDELRGAVKPHSVRFKRGELLGRGAHGCVHLALGEDDGHLMAVKSVPVPVVGDYECREALSNLRRLRFEIELMKTLDHESIVRYIGAVQSDGHLHILMQYVPGGSLAGLLRKFGPLNEEIIRTYTRQILKGLEYLHRHGIIHADLKGANVLVDTAGRCKLADFGASQRLKTLATDRSLSSTCAPSHEPHSLAGAGHCGSGVAGTARFIAPEVVKTGSCTVTADTWGLGCTVIEMATGKPPWSNIEEVAAVLYHVAGTDAMPVLPAHLSPQAHDFLSQCFVRDPEARPTATALLKHPFVQLASGGSSRSETPLPQQQPVLPEEGLPTPQSEFKAPRASQKLESEPEDQQRRQRRRRRSRPATFDLSVSEHGAQHRDSVEDAAVAAAVAAAAAAADDDDDDAVPVTPHSWHGGGVMGSMLPLPPSLPAPSSRRPSATDSLSSASPRSTAGRPTGIAVESKFSSKSWGSLASAGGSVAAFHHDAHAPETEDRKTPPPPMSPASANSARRCTATRMFKCLTLGQQRWNAKAGSTSQAQAAAGSVIGETALDVGATGARSLSHCLVQPQLQTSETEVQTRRRRSRSGGNLQPLDFTGRQDIETAWSKPVSAAGAL